MAKTQKGISGMWLRIPVCTIWEKHLGDFLLKPRPLFLIPLSSHKGYTPCLGQGPLAACLPGTSGSSFDLLLFPPAQSYLISPGRGRGIYYLAINS